MIRHDLDGHCLLIPQDEHARIAGELARRVGNAIFAPIEPQAVEAIAIHDRGWTLFDDPPRLDGRGLPMHFFDSPIELAVRAWNASIEAAAAVGPAATLLVSIHALHLSAHATGRRRDPPLDARDLFELNRLQQNEIERQETLRRQLGLRTDTPLRLGLARGGASPTDDLLNFNYRWLSAADRLSLVLCCSEHLFASIDDVHARPGGATIDLALSADDDEAIGLEPWPFATDEFAVSATARRVDNLPADPAGFEAAWRGAPVHALFWTLRRPDPS